MRTHKLLTLLALTLAPIAGCGDDDEDRWSDNSYDRPGQDRPRPDYDRPPPRPNSGRWVPLVAESLNEHSGRASIGGQGRRDRFREFRITCVGAETQVQNVVVHFSNGQKYRPGGRIEFNGSHCTEIIGLPRDGRDIERITFDYRKRDRDRRATATIFAR